MTDPTRGASELRAMGAMAAGLRERAERLQSQLAELSETVTSADRLVSVTVGAGGIMRSIRLESGGQSADPAKLLNAVMKAYAAGCRQVGQRAADLMSQHAPGSPAVEMMRDAIPPEPENEGVEYRG